jgi:hypothetical protein
MHRTGWFGIASLAWVFVAESAAACDYRYSVLTVETSGNGERPGAIGDITYTVTRGKGPERNGCEQSMTSCDDIGSVALHFAPSEDADSEFGAVGYRIRVVGGTLPEGLELRSEPLLAFQDGDEGDAAIGLPFVDGAHDDQESIAFTIRITPVDADGNEGPESDPILIRDEGGDGCGVARGGSGHGPSTALLVVALALGLRRRR